MNDLKTKHANNKAQIDNNSTSLIMMNNVVKTFHTPAGTFEALKGISLQIEQGELVAIIGKSGSGKTTLLNMLTGIARPSSGEIFIESTSLHQLSESQSAKWRRNQIGIVFQFFQLLPTLTVVENIMLPMDFSANLSISERQQRAMELLKQMGIAQHAHKLPLELSGGQQQRVAIARSLANDPPIIIADEPTGNLDSETADMVLQLLKTQVSRGKTVIIVTHDRDFYKQVHRTITLADGLVVEEMIS